MLAKNLIWFIWAYRNTIDSVIISPMGDNFRADNYNLKIEFESERMSGVFATVACDHSFFEGNGEKSRLSKLSSHYLLMESSFSGHKAFTAFNKLEYIIKSFTLKNRIETVYNLNINIKILNSLNGKEISDHDYESAFYIHEEDAIKRKAVEFVKDELKRITHLPYNLNELSLEGIIQWIEKKDESHWRHIVDFYKKCDNQYDRLIIGKIRSGTALTPKDVEKYDGFKDAYKELIKIKSALRKDNTLVKQ